MLCYWPKFLQSMGYLRIMPLLTAKIFNMKLEKWTSYPLYLFKCCKKLGGGVTLRYAWLLHLTKFLSVFLEVQFHVFRLQVEFKSILSTSKDLQFSVEVSESFFLIYFIIIIIVIICLFMHVLFYIFFIWLHYSLFM